MTKTIGLIFAITFLQKEMIGMTESAEPSFEHFIHKRTAVDPGGLGTCTPEKVLSLHMLAGEY